MSVDVGLLRKAVEWAEAEAAKGPSLSEWEQSYFVLPNSDSSPQVSDIGWTPSFDRDRLGKASDCGTCYCIAGYVDQVMLDTPSKYYDIEDSARSLLGLSTNQADDLFSAWNTIEDVRRIAEEIAGEKL